MTTEPQTGPAAFSPSDAALEGVRVARRHPWTILAWSVIYFAGVAAIGGVMLLMLRPEFMALARAGKLLTDVNALGDALAGSWPAFMLVLLLTVFLTAIMTAGVFRLVLRPDQQRSFAHLRIGPDELRLAGVNLILLGIGFAFLLIGLLVTSLATFAGPLTATLAGAACVGAGLYVGVRLVLVTPLTFEEGRISIADGWRLTRGRFWPLFGMSMMAVIFYLLVYLFVMIVAALLGEVFGGQAALANFRDATTVAIIAGVTLLGMPLVLQILQLVMIYGPFAMGLHQLRSGVALATRGEKADGMPSFFNVYDEAFSSWSGRISNSHHWAAVGYWFLSLLGFIVVMAVFGVATLQGTPEAAGAGFALCSMLTLPIYIMLLLSTVKRGRVLRVPGWLTTIFALILPLIAVAYGLIARRRP